MRSWLGNRLRNNGSKGSLSDVQDESAQLEEALEAAGHIMDDDLELAEEKLLQGDSAFHKVGLGLVSFMRAVLGMEKDAMAEAQQRLSDAENAAYEGYLRARNYPEASPSLVYSAGAEFLLCQAQVQLMAAVVGVLTESLGAALSSFYKLRKAYLSLDGLLAEEKKYLESLARAEGTEDVLGRMEPVVVVDSKPIQNGMAKDHDSDAEEWFDVGETPGLNRSGAGTPRERGVPEVNNLSKAMEESKIDEKETEDQDPLRRVSTQIPDGPDKDVFTTYVDAFVHSSSNMCFGMLLIMLSMMPPAFQPLIKMVGLKGDRKRGIALLWQASKFGNLNGAFAGLVLLGYYNNFISFCDIVPSSGSGAYPRARCKNLLESFRERYPQSCLWMLEESRMLSSEQKLFDALGLLGNMPESKLKQVVALQYFELSMNRMFTHQYELCSESFVKMVGLNNWSHGLYYYIAACARIERYREMSQSDHSRAAEQKRLAQKFLDEVPKHVGKKRIVGRQLPFDVFVGRKLQKWQARAKEHQVDLVDAAGVAPLAEMAYFWNGFKRMRQEDLEKSLLALKWSESSANKVPWESEDVDEKGIHALLSATALRNLGRTNEAREILENNVLIHDKSSFKGGDKENWIPPCAHYEVGVTYWNDYAKSANDDDLNQCLKYLDTVSAWESFDLDARLGMRIKTGQNTVKTLKERLS